MAIAIANKPKIKLIATSILRALEYLHSIGIIHADIKPGNILLHKSDVYTAKLCDFGLSLQLPKGEETAQVGNMYGSSDYMAPEIIKSGIITTKSDIYSFGVLLNAMFTGSTSIMCDDSLALDLISKCLESNYEIRPSASQALSHEWFHE